MKSVTFTETYLQKLLPSNPPQARMKTTARFYLLHMTFYFGYSMTITKTWLSLMFLITASRLSLANLQADCSAEAVRGAPAQRLTYQVGEEQVMDLLAHPSDCRKRDDHGHEVLTERARVHQLYMGSVSLFHMTTYIKTSSSTQAATTLFLNLKNGLFQRVGINLLFTAFL